MVIKIFKGMSLLRQRIVIGMALTLFASALSMVMYAYFTDNLELLHEFMDLVGIETDHPETPEQ